MLTHIESTAQTPARVALLGGSGFVGQALAAVFADLGTEVWAPTSAEVDLTDPASVPALAAGVRDSAVVFLAALTPNRGRDNATLRKNILMAEHVCAAMQASQPHYCLYVSSDAVYGAARPLIADDHPPAPDDVYGAMHLTRELMMLSQFKAITGIARLVPVYGSADTHNSYGPNRFRKQALEEGKISLFGGGEETRDHIYIDDATDILVKMVRRRSVGDAIIASGQSASFFSIAEMIAAKSAGTVSVATSERQNPITHRAYKPFAVQQAFPQFSFISLPVGISRTLADEQQSAV